jgi:hypothetical protein
MTVINPAEWEVVNGKWVRKSTVAQDSSLPDISDSTPDLGDSTSDLGMDIDSMDLGDSTPILGGSTPILGGSTPDLGGGGLANALSGPVRQGYGTRFEDVMSGTALVQPTWKKKDLTGLSGMDIQQDVNQKMVEAGEGMSATLLKENYGGAGKSFDAGAARQMAAQMGAAGAQRQAAGVTTRFGHEMQNYMENLGGRSQMADETNKLSAWLINRGQSNRDLQFGLQNINASMYAQQLATQMALAGIPLDMISSLIGSLGGLGGGGLLGGIMDPITSALQG